MSEQLWAIKPSKRAARRHHRLRVIKRGAFVGGTVWRASNDQEWLESFARRFASVRKECSGMCCGGRRRYEGTTIAELRGNITFAEEFRASSAEFLFASSNPFWRADGNIED